MFEPTGASGSGTGSGAKNYLSSYNGNIGNGDFESGSTAGWSLFNTAQTVTITIAAPGVMTTSASHGYVVGQPVVFTTTGALPTGLTAETTYYVSSVPSARTFSVSTTQGGSSLTTTGSQSGVHTVNFASGSLVAGPVTLTAASITTFNLVSSGQLAQTASLQTASSGAWALGQGFISSAFTIDIEDQAKPITLKAYYKAVTNPTNGNFSGTSSNTFAMYVYDVTNSAWIQPAGVYGITQNSGVGYVTGTFQTTSNSTQYRVAIVAVNASAGAITMYWDDFFFGPQTAPIGMPGSDWASYTPVTQGIGTPTITESFWMRIGGNLFVKGRATLGTTTAATLQIGLPAGAVISSTFETSTAINGVIQQGGTNSLVPLITGGNTFFTAGNQTAGTALTSILGNTLSSASVISWLVGPIPISGWSANVQMSNDTDTRVVSLIVTTANNAATTSAPFLYTAVVNDSHAGYSAATGKYTVPVSGVYQIYASAQVNTTANKIGIRKNASLIINGPQSSTLTIATVAGMYTFVAGDTIDIVPDASVTPTSSAINDYLMITRVSGPSVIAATESVNARYFASATSISGSLATVVWTTKDFDSHNAMSSGVYTIPVSGKYQINCEVALAGTIVLNNTVDLQLQKNSTAISEDLRYAGGAITNFDVGVTDIISCLAGDTIRIQVSSSATAPSIVASNTRNFFSISRVGN